MNPIIQHVWTPEERAHQGSRGTEDCSVEALVRRQQQLAGWIHRRGPQAGAGQRRSRGMSPEA
jgi:hypothetical protein